ncbi:unnamed protein product [Orchesella dallaii]|uniref:PSI domain-containing protein n=1 Tax=Orchesella dallaii TaxID=48710 RepID=A0ABP1Q9J1_9HEXA
MGNLVSKFLLPVLTMVVHAYGGKDGSCFETTCAACTQGKCSWCVSREKESCRLNWQQCQNGTFMVIGPRAQCPLISTTTTTTTTPPPEASSQFYFFFFVVTLTVVGIFVVIIIASFAFHRRDWCRRRIEERRRVQGEETAISYRELEAAVERGSICISRGPRPELEQVTEEIIEMSPVPTLDLDEGDVEEELFSRV